MLREAYCSGLPNSILIHRNISLHSVKERKLLYNLPQKVLQPGNPIICEGAGDDFIALSLKKPPIYGKHKLKIYSYVDIKPLLGLFMKGDGNFSKCCDMLKKCCPTHTYLRV